MKTINEIDLRFILEELILADLKHSQLTIGLANLGLDPMDNHFLGIADLVARLIGVQNDQEKDRFMDVYMEFMNRSADSHVDTTNEALKRLSKECIEALHGILV